jgi:hypothetical protein
VEGSFERTIQMHCGGQTFAQIPHEVQRISFLPSSTSSYTRNGTIAEFFRLDQLLFRVLDREDTFGVLAGAVCNAFW